MVLAFLRAEFHSPRFKGAVRHLLQDDADLLYRTRLDDPAENNRRQEILGAYRGFNRDGYLFTGFPTEVAWSRIALDRDEVGELLYANYPTWVTLWAALASLRTVQRTSESSPSMRR